MSSEAINEISNRILRYTNEYDVFVALLEYIKERERRFCDGILDSENKLIGLADKDADNNLQDQITACINDEPSKFSHTLTSILSAYPDYYRSIICRVIKRFDMIKGKKQLQFLNNNRGMDVSRPCKPLNSHGKHKLYLSTRALEEHDYRLGRVPEKRGCSVSALLHYFTLSMMENDYELEVSSCTDKDVLELTDKFKDEFNVGISHFTSSMILDDVVKENRFSVKGIIDEDKQLKKLKRILSKMEKKGVNVAVFPEMLFTTNMIEPIQEHLIDISENLKLVVLGSIWEDRTNRSVMLTGNGKEVHTQFKLNPFHKSDDFSRKGVNEDLSLENRVLKLLDIRGFGRISNIICVDLITEELDHSLKTIGVSFYFSPIYTTTITSMKQYASSRFANFGSLTFVANCCKKPVEEGKRVTSFVMEDKSRTKDLNNCLHRGSKECMTDGCFELITYRKKQFASHEHIKVE